MYRKFISYGVNCTLFQSLCKYYWIFRKRKRTKPVFLLVWFLVYRNFTAFALAVITLIVIIFALYFSVQIDGKSTNLFLTGIVGLLSKKTAEIKFSFFFVRFDRQKLRTRSVLASFSSVLKGKNYGRDQLLLLIRPF